MEGVTGTMAWLSHVPGCSRAGLYGPANIDFRFVSQLRLQRAFCPSDAKKRCMPLMAEAKKRRLHDTSLRSDCCRSARQR